MATQCSTKAAPGARNGPNPVLHNITLRATPRAVRAALIALRRALAGSGVPPGACGTVEIALAEALNNIAEHAYDTTAPGDIRVTLTTGHRAATACQAAAISVDVRLIDAGAPLPGNHPPAALLPVPGDDRDTLSEGGYGWFLIHSLTDRLTYTRQGGKNHLHLRFAFPPPAMPPRAGRHGP